MYQSNVVWIIVVFLYFLLAKFPNTSLTIPLFDRFFNSWPKRKLQMSKYVKFIPQVIVRNLLHTFWSKHDLMIKLHVFSQSGKPVSSRRIDTETGDSSSGERDWLNMNVQLEQLSWWCQSGQFYESIFEFAHCVLNCQYSTNKKKEIQVKVLRCCVAWK